MRIFDLYIVYDIPPLGYVIVNTHPPLTAEPKLISITYVCLYKKSRFITLSSYFELNVRAKKIVFVRYFFGFEIVIMGKKKVLKKIVKNIAETKRNT